MLHILQTALIYLGSFVVVLSVVVTVHELGHFWAARICRIPVKSFSLGFGPQLLALRDKHDTVWKISAIPLGGFVSWIDDTDPTSTLPASDEQRELSPREQRERGFFRAQPIWARSFVTAAGPLSNFIFSIFAFALLAFIVGKDVTDYTHVPARVQTVAPHTAASTAGLQRGDVILSIDGAPVQNFAAMQDVILASPEHALALRVQRGANTLAITATPGKRAAGADHAGQGVLGVSGPMLLPQELRTERYNVFECLTIGVRNVWGIVSLTVDYIGKVITGHASADQIAGPLGILTASGQQATAALEAPPLPQVPGGAIGMLVLSLFALAATLSVAVGFVNVLPIPVLDGGHLFFYAIEAIRGGRPLPPRAQEFAFWTGVSVLLSLFLFATWNDITHHLPGVQ